MIKRLMLLFSGVLLLVGNDCCCMIFSTEKSGLEKKNEDSTTLEKNADEVRQLDSEEELKKRYAVMEHLVTELYSFYKEYDEIVGFTERPEYEIEREDRKPSKSQSKFRFYVCTSPEYLEKTESVWISQGYRRIRPLAEGETLDEYFDSVKSEADKKAE